MANSAQFYEQMAARTAEQITGSYQEWTAFLATAARLYKYPYHEQLMIYAQRRVRLLEQADAPVCPARVQRHCPGG